MGFKANLKQVNYLTLFRESFQKMQVREKKLYAFIRGSVGFPCCCASTLPIIIFPAGIDMQDSAIFCIAVILNGKGPGHKPYRVNQRSLSNL